MERDGIVNKLIGDAVLAIFDFPIERDSHVENAVLSAIGLQERWASRCSIGEGDSQMPIGVGVGIHTGTVAVGKWERRAPIYCRGFGSESCFPSTGCCQSGRGSRDRASL